MDIAFCTEHMGKVRSFFAVLAPLSLCPGWEVVDPISPHIWRHTARWPLRGGVGVCGGEECGGEDSGGEDSGLPILTFPFPALIRQEPTEA